MSKLDWIQVKSSDDVARTMELRPLYEKRKSYYGRAFIHHMKDGRILLQSYNTIVAGVITTLNGENLLCIAPIDSDLLTVTTCRHIRAFICSCGARYHSWNLRRGDNKHKNYNSGKAFYRASSTESRKMLNEGEILSTAFQV